MAAGAWPGWALRLLLAVVGLEAATTTTTTTTTTITTTTITTTTTTVTPSGPTYMKWHISNLDFNLLTPTLKAGVTAKVVALTATYVGVAPSQVTLALSSGGASTVILGTVQKANAVAPSAGDVMQAIVTIGPSINAAIIGGAGNMGAPMGAQICASAGANCVTQTGGSSGNSADLMGDPITYYGDVRQEFWLPLGILTPVMNMPDLKILASTFQGHGEEQWMDRIVVTSLQGETVVDVRIRRDLESFDKSKLAPGAFQTIDVHMDWVWVNGAASAMVERPPADAFFQHWRGLRVATGTIRAGHDMPRSVQYETNIGEAERETVVVHGSHGKVVISSMSAAEYYGHDSTLSVKYAHLDIMFLDMHDEHTFTGLLPELWGVQPLSEASRRQMKAPAKAEELDV